MASDPTVAAVVAVPDVLARTVRALHGDAGDAWLAGLPSLVAALADEWGLEPPGPPFPGLSYHYVAPAARRLDGLPLALKLGVPGADAELMREAAALRFYDGRGVARLLRSDPARGALLLERVRPGGTLAATVTDAAADERATRVAARVMRRLWRTLPLDWRPGGVYGDDPDKRPPFPLVAEWLGGLDRLRAADPAPPFPAALLDAASGLARDLLASSAEPVLLHGDLHHFNLLFAPETRDGRDAWLAIDPKGVIGESAYEAGALLRNPLPRLFDLPDPARVLGRRLDILTEELGLDRERLRGWGIAQAVLSAWWCREDGQGEECWGPALRVAELLEENR